MSAGKIELPSCDMSKARSPLTSDLGEALLLLLEKTKMKTFVCFLPSRRDTSLLTRSLKLPFSKGVLVTKMTEDTVWGWREQWEGEKKIWAHPANAKTIRGVGADCILIDPQVVKSSEFLKEVVVPCLEMETHRFSALIAAPKKLGDEARFAKVDAAEAYASSSSSRIEPFLSGTNVSAFCLSISSVPDDLSWDL